MTNEEAILVLKSTSVNLGRRCGKIAYAEALEMAINALQQLDNNSTKPDNSTATQSNGIESKVKGFTACRVPEDDTISRRQAIDIFDDYNVSVENGELEAYSRDRKRLCDLPPVQPETCKGCKHLGKWENEIEYGYPSPCTGCKRRAGDRYER